MAYVQPNSIVQLFKGINLDNRYMHTIYFANESAQNSWFTGKVTYTFQQISYTRYTRNSIKLKADTTDIMDCTYLRFKNDRSVDKWFYAFINSVEYVNENTCLITYEIDVMQTWFIQSGSIEPCYVLRHHVSDDTFGINLEAEPIGSEVYDCDKITTDLDAGGSLERVFLDYDLIMETTGQPFEDRRPFPTNMGTFINNGLLCGVSYYQFRTSGVDLTEFNTALSALTMGSWDEKERKEDVIDMFTFPRRFCNVNASENIEQLDIQHPSNLDGYVPKNKKLFGYPYSYLQATTGDGDGSLYKWEYFDGDKTQPNNPCRFEIIGTPVGGGQIICYPTTYNGKPYDYDSKMVMNEFPKNAYAFDAYQAWEANGGKIKARNESIITAIKGVIGIIGSVGQGASDIANGIHNYTTTGSGDSAVTGLSMGNVSEGFKTAQKFNATAGIVSGLANTLNTVVSSVEAQQKVDYLFKDARYTPNQVVGACTPSISVGQRLLNFYFYSVHVRNDELKRIDDFLSCYGYAINKVEQPNLHSRQYWNFIQTQGAVIAGNMPSSSKEAIARIFDGGITFWHNGDQIGNYRQSVTQGSINNPII